MGYFTWFIYFFDLLKVRWHILEWVAFLSSLEKAQSGIGLISCWFEKHCFVIFNCLWQIFVCFRSSHWRCNIYRKTSGLESLYIEVAGLKTCKRPATYWKETPTDISCEYCEIFMNNCFEKHLRWLLLMLMIHFCLSWKHEKTSG